MSEPRDTHDGWPLHYRFRTCSLACAQPLVGRLSGGLFWQFGGHGSQAVIVFFVLSGFVIVYMADTKHQGMRGFMKCTVAGVIMSEQGEKTDSA